MFDALFADAEQFLRGHGMRIARGPFSLTINHESGLLVEGFDTPHVVRTNHAPPYYASHIERLGYRKAMDLVAYVARVAEFEVPERIARTLDGRSDPIEYSQPVVSDLAARLSARAGALQRRLVRQRLGDAGRSGRGEVHRRPHAAGLPPGWIRIASYDGEDVAVLAQIPDANEALQGLHGRLLPFGFASLLWRIHVRGARRTRVPMAGVAKKWRNTKVAIRAAGALAALAVEDARKAGVEEIEFSWMLETNATAINAVRSAPARQTRTFRIYERSLAP